MNRAINNLANALIVVPVLLLSLLLLPGLILWIVFGEWRNARKRSKFLKRNAGKRILCVTHGQRYRKFQTRYGQRMLSAGIDEIVVFDGSKNGNEFDGFAWENMIARDKGFPLLVMVEGKALRQESIRKEVLAFFHKEMDWVQLTACIKEKIDGRLE